MLLDDSIPKDFLDILKYINRPLYNYIKDKRSITENIKNIQQIFINLIKPLSPIKQCFEITDKGDQKLFDQLYTDPSPSPSPKPKKRKSNFKKSNKKNKTKSKNKKNNSKSKSKKNNSKSKSKNKKNNTKSKNKKNNSKSKNKNKKNNSKSK